MQTLSEIKGLLAKYGLRPKKRFGQNFLHDGNQMQRIMEAAEIERGELVLEVGPGTGALSERLLASGAELVAVEVDRDLEPILRERLTPYGDRATVLIADVLAGKHAVNPEVVALLGGRAFKLIANLPYNVASPLLVNLSVDHPGMRMGLVMVQREVADRLTAGPGSKSYGPLGIMVGSMCEVERVMVLGPGCFWPRPEVESAVVRLRRREQPLTKDPRKLSRLVHVLFTKRRKQLGSILGRDAELPAGVKASDRPDTLSVSQLELLARMAPPPGEAL